MKKARWLGVVGMAGLLLTMAPWNSALPQGEPVVAFAVVTKVSKDKTQVMAQVSTGGPAAEAPLIPTDSILDNLVWKKLEVCHALRLEVWKNQEGYRVVSVKALDAGMLPMSLQSVAGDCLIKKALEFAPLVD